MDKLTARHEAGHAIVAHARGVAVQRIELSPNGDGCAWYEGPSELLDRGLDPTSVSFVYGLIAAAGRAASPETSYSANDNDNLSKAFWLCGLSDCDFDLFRQACFTRAGQLLAERADAVDRVAGALVERGYLGRDEFLELVGGVDDEAQ